METVIRSFQPTEDGIYPLQNNVECVNLISVWRMRELSKPFLVSELQKLSDGLPLSTNRQRAGGWSYVNYPTQEWVESHF